MDVSGLSSVEAKKRLQENGYNEITTQEKRTPLSIFLAQFPTFLNAILFLAAVFSFVAHDAIDGGFIVAIILLNGLFGFIQEYRAEKSLEKLRTYTTPIIRVFRDGKEKTLPTRELVPDDIILLSEGDRIPTDGVFIKSNDLEIDEAILTGESLPVRKKKQEEGLAGTLIVKGNGFLRVTRTGNATEFGKIAQTLSTLTAEKTPLQIQLMSLSKVLSVIAITFAMLLIPFGLWQKLDPQTLFLLVISVAVAAIPEGLPAVITIALAIGTNRLAKRKAIVRQMPSIETLGAIQILLVDKTGTLTQNKMQVKDITLVKKDYQEQLFLAAMLGNTASLIRNVDNTTDIAGDTTDGALLAWVHEQKPDIVELIHQGKILKEYVFEAQSKTVTTLWEHDNNSAAYVRGAPEAILAASSLSSADRRKYEEIYQDYGKKGLRVIGFGFKPLHQRTENSRKALEDTLTFLGFLALYDPPRIQAPEAVKKAKQAGIRTIMVTGDNAVTATSIAKEIGLFEKDDRTITGHDLERMSDEEVIKILPHTRIFARSQPMDKLRITKLLMQQGFIVGVTGDGVNDTLALKKANVGISMGQTGTDVAKESSDIILTDDNFATLVDAVQEGRAIYQNIVTAILYLLTSNFSELCLILLSLLLGLPVVLLPTQILWINLVTDGLPALALATDPSSQGMLNRPPRNPKIPLLTRKRLLFVLLGGFALAGILTGMYSLLLEVVTPVVARTVLFNTLIFSHLMLALLIRGRSLIPAPRFLILTIIGTLSMQTLITFVPFFQKLFQIGL